MIKSDLLHLKITPEQKQRIKNEANSRGEKFTDFVLNGLDFYASFPPEFLDQINIIAEKVKQDIPTVIQHMLLTYTATDAAISETFGLSKTFSRAFQYDEKGLVTGTALSNLVFNQVDAEVKKLVKRIKKGADQKVSVPIDVGEALLIAGRL